MSHVMCHLSGVTCRVSGVMCQKEEDEKRDEVVELVIGGSVINRAASSSLFIQVTFINWTR